MVDDMTERFAHDRALTERWWGERDHGRVQRTVAVIAPERTETPQDQDAIETSLPWNVVVWNDPINLMDYVVFVFRKVFGHSLQKATKLMLAVHNEGRAIVSSGPLEKAEIDVAAMHHHGLWATLERP